MTQMRYHYVQLPILQICSIYYQRVWAAVLQECRFRHESSTPWHLKRRRRQMTWITNILKSTAYSLRTGASFQANLASIHGETMELRACQKVRTDRQHFVFI